MKKEIFDFRLNKKPSETRLELTAFLLVTPQNAGAVAKNRSQRNCHFYRHIPWC
ncbi:MAG: hypothetical protein IJ644_00575 [Oscillospiraceae bacterium]|nr:hypothetical protein [Oscillospiraceae bacterium]